MKLKFLPQYYSIRATNRRIQMKEMLKSLSETSMPAASLLLKVRARMQSASAALQSPLGGQQRGAGENESHFP